MEKKIISLGLILLIASGISFAAICDEEWMTDKLESAEAQEKAAYSKENMSSYYFEEAASSYKNLADCSESNKNYDDAIKYRTKAIEMSKKAGISYALSHAIIADYYFDNNSGFNGEIREHCEAAEKLLLEEIDEELAKDKPYYLGISMDYGDIADCYKLINDTEKSCMYCNLNNEYVKKHGSENLKKCVEWGYCLKSSSSNSPVADSGGGLSFVLLVMAFLSVVILGAVFLLARRSRGAK